MNIKSKKLFKETLFCIIFFLISLIISAQTEQETVVFLDRYKNFLLADSFISAQKIPDTDVDGKWADINYKDQQPGVWEPAVHLKRVKILALNWSAPGSSYYHSPLLKDKISLALKHWFTNRYKCINWWHNEIGVPQVMRDIIILMEGGLSKEEWIQSLEVLAQHKVARAGANLVWSADLGLHYAALTKNYALMKQCRDTILTTFQISSGEGIQPDYSFHQHGKRLQTFQYGSAFLPDNIRITWQLRGLSLAYPADKVRILVDFILEGWQWMARGITTVPGTIDRSVSRINALQNADLRRMIPLLYEIQPGSINAFKKLLFIQQGKVALTGYRYYPYSDFTVFHQPGFSFFLKTISTRTLPSESINNENLKGELLNCGDSYFMSDGNEYFNLMPVWDWDKLPGITNFPGDRKDKIRQHHFTGNVSDGDCGLAVMGLTLKKNEQSLKANKFWVSYKNITVVLISGLEAKGITEPAFTVMDQCRWRGSVTVNAVGNMLKKGTHTVQNARWIHHKDFVYIPLASAKITIKLTDTSGRWTSINASQPYDLVNDKVFLPFISHDANDTSSGFVVAYADHPSKAANIAQNPYWKVARNTSLCQAVYFENGPLMAAFYASTKETLGNKIIAVNKPCTLLIQKNKLFISDPSHTGGEFLITVDNIKYRVDVPSDGTTRHIPL